MEEKMKAKKTTNLESGMILGCAAGSSSTGSCEGKRARNYMKSLVSSTKKQTAPLSASRLKKLSEELEG
jgi:hypothetical protein